MTAIARAITLIFLPLLIGGSACGQQIADFATPIGQRIPVREPIGESTTDHVVLKAQSPVIRSHVEGLAYPSRITQPMRLSSFTTPKGPISLDHSIRSGLTLDNLNDNLHHNPTDSPASTRMTGAQTIRLRWNHGPVLRAEAYSTSETQMHRNLESATTLSNGLRQTLPLIGKSKVTAMVESREWANFQSNAFSSSMAKVVLEQPLPLPETSVQFANTWQHESQDANPAYERDVPAFETRLLWNYHRSGSFTVGTLNAETEFVNLSKVDSRRTYLATVRQRIMPNTDLHLRAAYETVKRTTLRQEESALLSDNLTLSAVTSVKMIDSLMANLALRYRMQDSQTAKPANSNIGVSFSVNGWF